MGGGEVWQILQDPESRMDGVESRHNLYNFFFVYVFFFFLFVHSGSECSLAHHRSDRLCAEFEGECSGHPISVCNH